MCDICGKNQASIFGPHGKFCTSCWMQSSSYDIEQSQKSQQPNSTRHFTGHNITPNTYRLVGR